MAPAASAMPERMSGVRPAVTSTALRWSRTTAVGPGLAGEDGAQDGGVGGGVPTGESFAGSGLEAEVLGRNGVEADVRMCGSRRGLRRLRWGR